MSRPLYTPSSCPVTPEPGALLLFIQHAQHTLVYRTSG
jgi:hypothetical protein